MRLLLFGIFALAPGFGAECPSPSPGAPETQARFQDLDRRAQIEFRRAEFSKASADFRQATCLAPEGIRSYYELYGNAAGAIDSGDFGGARQALVEADRLRPDYPLPLAMLVKVSLTSGATGDLKTSLLAAARRFPRDGRLHADLAQDLLHYHQYDLALAEALRAEESGAAGTRVGLNLAVLENQAGAFSDAARLAAAIEAQPSLPGTERASAAGIAGLSLESLGQSREAIGHFKLAIRSDPHQEQPYLGLARIYAEQQDHHAAVEILSAARKILGDSPQVLLALGSALVSAEQYQGASEMLAGLIQRFPEQFEAYAMLAEAYRNVGEPRRATQTLLQLAQRKENDPMLHVVIARSLLDEEKIDYPLVLQELAAAEKVVPDDYDIAYLRGKVFLATGAYAQAVASLQRAIELNPTEPGARYQLGLSYRKLGKADLAKEQFERLEFLKGTAEPLQARD